MVSMKIYKYNLTLVDSYLVYYLPEFRIGGLFCIGRILILINLC